MLRSRLQRIQIVNNQPTDDRYTSAILLGLLGVAIAPQGKRLQTGIAFAVASPFLARLAVESERQRQEATRQEWLAKMRAAILASRLKLVSNTAQAAEPLSLTNPAMLPSEKPVEIERDSKWREVIVPPSIVVILGKRGSGKSALGYRLLELFRYGPVPCVLGLPQQAHGLLPDWIGVVPSLEDVPSKSIVLVDEAYLRYHSRESLAAGSRELSRILNLSRQRQQSFVFVSQEARQVDRNIVSSANVIIFKDLGMLQLQFDRPELTKLAAQAKQAFEVVRGERRSWSYVYSPDADSQGLLENCLPTFWSRSLSHAFAACGEALPTKLPKRIPLEEKIRKAKELHQGGLSYKEIANMMGVTKGTVYNYVKDYPYQR